MRANSRPVLVSLIAIAGACSEANPPEPATTTFQSELVPSGYVDELVVSGIPSPTAMAFAPDGRLFVSQQNGQLRVVSNGTPRTLLPTPFLTVTVSSAGERGLLGVAFDPAFATNGFVYVYYTATTPGDSQPGQPIHGEPATSRRRQPAARRSCSSSTT